MSLVVEDVYAGPEQTRKSASTRIRFWNRLSVKLLVVTLVPTLICVAGIVILGLRTHEDHQIREVVRGAALFSDTIKSSTYHDMLEDRRASAYLVMETIGRQEGIRHVRFFNKEGRVTFSTRRAEIDTMVDKGAESCYACHAAGKPIVRLAIPSRSRIYDQQGERVLGMVTPIYNEPSCYTAACHVHPQSQRVLGVVDIGISLAAIDRDVASLRRRSFALAGLALLALAAIVAAFSHRVLVAPVRRMVAATRRIAATGALDERVPVMAADELGRLANSFNNMTESLARVRAERTQLLETLERQVEERTAALKEAQAQLIQSEKLSSLGKLAASIAHEINNPLAGILTYAKLLVRLLSEGPVTEKTQASCVRHLSLVQRETERCTAIVRNLLDFARQRPLSLKDVDVNAVVDEGLSLVGNQIALQNVQLTTDLQPVPPVKADFGQLRQAFVNIILNACEAMPKGGGLSVASRLTADGKTVEVVFRDTGVGIPPERLSRIFDPFFTTKEKGTGLGLSVVYGIIERHGGNLELHSEVDKGTEVRIRLPLAAERQVSA